MEYSIKQSAWRRGWNDTKSVWTSWQFYILDVVVAVVIGGLFDWYWGLVIVVFGMFCVWLGATASAPYNKRNEARQRIEELDGIMAGFPYQALSDVEILPIVDLDDALQRGKQAIQVWLPK
jgi:hypothetical protein